MYKYKRGTDGEIKKVRKKLTFSEKLLVVVLICVALVAVIAIAFAFINNCETVWWYLIPGVFGMGSVATGGFIWKAKAENLIKVSSNPNYDDEQLKMQIDYEIANQFVEAHREDYTNIY